MKPAASASFLTDESAGVLLVDDEPHILRALKCSLRNHPWQLYTAQSAEEGLEILSRESVQVVISDYRMSGMDGVTFLKQVKKQWPIVQRVMLTGQASFDAVEKAINESEVYRFMNKPWLDSHLVATISECLDHVCLLQSNQRYERELASRNRQLTELNLELEQKVEERTRALIQAEKMVALGRMAGGVAHEINNPLGGILAFAQLLLREDSILEDPQNKEALETIQTCALRCRDIVDNLLSFSRKSPPGERTPVDLNLVVRNALSIAKLHPKAKEIDVDLELDDSVPPVLGRANLLEQVVINLVHNALAAVDAGQHVMVRTKCRDERAFLEVEDDGVGIPAAVLPHVFEPFFTTKETGEGTGLGLSICYGIAEEHAGELSVQSEPGKGAKFTLMLPHSREDGSRE
jgi:signal transduction histidine kinase